MKDWFLSLSQRERTMVQVAASVIAIFVLYLLIIEPISSSYAKNKKNVATATETLTWMHSAAQEVKQLQGGRSLPDRPQGKQFVLSMVDRSAKNLAWVV